MLPSNRRHAAGLPGISGLSGIPGLSGVYALSRVTRLFGIPGLSGVYVLFPRLQTFRQLRSLIFQDANEGQNWRGLGSPTR